MSRKRYRNEEISSEEIDLTESEYEFVILSENGYDTNEEFTWSIIKDEAELSEADRLSTLLDDTFSKLDTHREIKSKQEDNEIDTDIIKESVEKAKQLVQQTKQEQQDEEQSQEKVDEKTQAEPPKRVVKSKGMHISIPDKKTGNAVVDTAIDKLALEEKRRRDLIMSTEKDLPYIRKSGPMTDAEFEFYRFMLDNLQNVIILSMCRLADIVSVNPDIVGMEDKTFFYKISSKHIDYLILDKKTGDTICAVELNDQTHLKSDRKERDKFIDRLMKQCNIPLIWINELVRDVTLKTLRPIEREIHAYQAPICPYCKEKMVPRETKDGKRFWGCRNYFEPGRRKCTHTISID